MAKSFWKGVTELVKTVMEGCKEIPEEELQRFHPREQIGICPLCGSPVYEGKQNFYCSKWGVFLCLVERKPLSFRYEKTA